jgi:hypothetical protein
MPLQEGCWIHPIEHGTRHIDGRSPPATRDGATLCP